MPKDAAKKYPEEIIYGQSEEYYALRVEYSMLTVVENASEHMN